MGGEIGSFNPVDSSGVEDTAYDYWNTNFSRCNLKSASYMDSPEAGWGLASGWAHGHLVSVGYPSGTRTMMMLVDDNGDEAIRLVLDLGANQLRLDYIDALAVWQTVDTISIGMEGAAHDCDVNWTVNSATGSLYLYVAGTKRIEGTGIDLSHITAIDKLRFYGSTFGPRSSQFIVADEPTIGWRLMTAYPSGAGANSAWSGTYTSIDEVRYSDADFIFSDNAGDVSTYTVTTVGSLTGYEVRAVGVGVRAKKGASGPTQMQIAIRAGGTDDFSSTVALDVGYAAYFNAWEQNPTTVADWLNADISSLQVGVKAIA